jgi:hypothetical protein
MLKEKKLRKNSRFIFTLKNINADQIEKKYNIIFTSNLNQENIPENITNINDILPNKNEDTNNICFIDEIKQKHKCIATMIDFTTNKNIKDLIYHCFWCRHSFDTPAIGCPIEYVSNKLTKKYHSEISKDDYKICENITTNKLNKIKNNLDNLNKKETTFIIDNDEYYITDGIFCSFNCALSFILENKHNSIYNHSEYLLTKLYIEMTNIKNKIMPAPSWRLLFEYGGNLSINNFRNRFNKCNYENFGTVCSKIKSIQYVFEEKITF